ncbi:MAG: hypothetical protein ACJA2E_000760 [Arenicella sp.]|jgi:hypothetical protein
MEGSEMEEVDSKGSKLKAEKFNLLILFGTFALFGGTLIVYILSFGLQLSDKHSR